MVALVILAAPVMLTNAYVAVDRVDQDAVTAAVAMGMQPLQVLLRVELPLALPLMFAGIRTAAVYVVATAPLAALAGGGGLGDIIVNQPTYGPEGVVAGSLVIAALAFATEGVFALLQYAVTPRPLRRRRKAASARAEGGNGRGMSDQTEGVQPRSPMRRRKIQTPLLMVLLLAVLAVFGLAACGGDDDSSSSSTSESSSSSSDQPGKGKPAVTLGTKDFTEEFVLGELYKQALEAKGYTVKLKKNIGSTEIIDKALTSHQIDGYPEYLGVSVAVVAGKDIIPKSDQETYDLAKQFYEGRGQTISQQTPFFDVDAIATTKDFATKNSLKSVADLKKLDSFTVGARPEFKSRYQGLKGMQKVYGLTNAQFKQLALGIQYQALDKGDVDSANVFSTDAQLASGKYTVLEDPKGIFGYQHVAMVFDKKKNDALGPEFFATIDGVSKLLTNDAMISMNKAVALDKQPEAEVAKKFLQANNLL